MSNPNHRPPGTPEGGEFTSGPSALVEREPKKKVIKQGKTAGGADLILTTDSKAVVDPATKIVVGYDPNYHAVFVKRTNYMHGMDRTRFLQVKGHMQQAEAEQVFLRSLKSKRK